MFKEKHGFTLIENLVVIAIICILVAITLHTASRALGQARNVAVVEAVRQDHLGRMADNANMVSESKPPPADKAACRAAFTTFMGTGKAGDAKISRMLYIAHNDAEFEAYWHTLLNADNPAPLRYTKHGDLIAENENGKEFYLEPMPGDWEMTQRHDRFPVLWEYFSMDLGETTMNGFRINVRFSKGGREHLRYPGEFPCTRTVAELTHRFSLQNQ